jgi:hypothetical protein
MARESADVELLELVERAETLLASIGDAEASRELAPGKWSRKQLLGHLIDSASNNHQRFVRAHFQADLVFAGYPQDDWIRVQRYEERSWSSLIALWRALNEHLAHVMRSTPRELRERVHTRHNLHQIAWREVPERQPVNLAWFHSDYVGHLRHHLRQALPDGDF